MLTKVNDIRSPGGMFSNFQRRFFLLIIAVTAINKQVMNLLVVNLKVADFNSGREVAVLLDPGEQLVTTWG